MTAATGRIQRPASTGRRRGTTSPQRQTRPRVSRAAGDDRARCASGKSDQQLQCVRRHALTRAQGSGWARRAHLHGCRLAETPYFTGAEGAALALTETATRLADRPGPGSRRGSGRRPPSTTTIGSSRRSIAGINAWNRINITTRQAATGQVQVTDAAAGFNGTLRQRSLVDALQRAHTGLTLPDRTLIRRCAHCPAPSRLHPGCIPVPLPPATDDSRPGTPGRVVRTQAHAADGAVAAAVGCGARPLCMQV